MGLALSREDVKQSLFRAGLAHRAGDGDDAGLAAGARGLAQSPHGVEDRVLARPRYREKAPCPGEFLGPVSRDHGRPGTTRQGIANEVVTVPRLTANGEEQVAPAAASAYRWKRR